MKKLKWIVIIVVIVVTVAITAVWVNLNGIVRRTIETQASSSLDLTTTLGGANVSLLGGNLALSKLEIASPPGFSAPHLITLGGIDLAASLSQLRAQPIHVKRIEIDKPTLVIEQANGKMNLNALLDQPSKTPPPTSSGGSSEPIKLVIDSLAVNNASVIVRPGIPGLSQEITINIPSVELANIGTGEGNENGAAIKQVIMLIATTLAQKAGDSDALPPEVRELMHLNMDQLKARVQGEVTKQLDKATKDLTKQLPGNVGKQVEKGVGDLLKGAEKPKKKATTRE